MKQLTTSYPIGGFLIKHFQESQLNLPAYVSALGYQNISKGIKRFREGLQSGRLERTFRARLCANLSNEQVEELELLSRYTEKQLKAELAEEQNRKEEYERARFAPLLHPIARLANPSITLFGLSGGFRKYIEILPRGIPSWTEDAQRAFIRQKITENFKKHEGTVKLLGPIVHYLYAPVYKAPLQEFSTNGDYIRSHNDRGLPSSWVSLAR